jgi:hypothetical protein
VAAQADDPSVTPVSQMPHLLVNGGAALATVAAKSQPGKSRVLDGAHLQRPDVPVRKCIVQVSPPATNPIVTAIATLHYNQAGEDLYVIVNQCEEVI